MTTIRENVFPARVFVLPPASPEDDLTGHPKNYVPTGATLLTDRARVVITTDSVFIYKDSPTGPVLVLDSRLDDIIGGRKTGMRLVLSDTPRTADSSATGVDFPAEPLSMLSQTTPGDLVIVKDSHCGCGSRLRYWNPFPSSAYASEK